MYAKSLAYYTLLASFYIGKTLFALIFATANKFSVLCSGILTAVQILLEDFGVFLHDLSEHAGFGLRIIYKSVECILGVFTLIYNPIASSLQWYLNITTSFCTWISNFYNNTTTLITFLLINAKKLLVLFGSGVWFALTIVPVAIFSASLLLIYYIGVLIDEINILKNNVWSCLLQNSKNLVEFFWDVPLEALLGLAGLACIVYICGKYVTYIRINALKCIRSIHSWMSFKIPQPINFAAMKEPLKMPKKAILNADQSICVVCQAKPKNMLILPCKHLCTCEECMNQIKRYSGRCPMCRTQMDRTILVYI